MNPELLRKVERSAQCVAEEESAQALAVEALIDGQTREKNDGHGVTWQLPGDIGGKVIRLD